jgi:hypothetical protein
MTLAAAGSEIIGAFTNSNGVSFGTNTAGNITASVASLLLTLAGNTTGTLAAISTGTMSLVGGNNITLSQVGNAVTISGPNIGGAQTGISGIVASNATYTSGTVSFQNANGISFGSSGVNGISASYTVPIQSNQTLSLAATSNTAGNTSGMSVDARSLTLAGYGAVSVGYSTSVGGSSVIVSAPVQTVQTQNLVDVTLAGNTTGTLALVSSGTLTLAGGNNITLSQVGNAVTLIGPSGGGIGVAVSNTTYTSGTVTFQNANGISFGSSGANGISASYTVPVQTNQTLSLAAASNTAGNTSGMSVDARSLTLAGYGAVSVGYSTSAGGSSVVVSAPVQTVQTVGVYALSNTTGAASSSTYDARTLSFAGYGIISIGHSNGTIQISGPTTTGVTQLSVGMSTLGNTTGTTGLASQQLVLAGGNNLTLSGSVNAGSMTITILAPAISSISGTGAVSVVVNGSTISIGAPLAPPQLSFLNAMSGDVTTLTQIGNGSVQVYPINTPVGFSASRADMMVFNSISSSSNSSHAGVISVYMALYTLNGSTLSMASSGSQSYQWTNTSSNSMGSISGQRRLSVPINVNYTGGDIWMAVMSQTASTNTNWFSASNMAIQPVLTGQLMGLMGQAANNTYQIQPGYGLWSTTSGVMPGSMALTAISGAGSAGQGANVYMVPVQFCNMTA